MRALTLHRLDPRIDKLFRDLQRPMYVYRMAEAQLHAPVRAKGAEKRMAKAKEEIEEIITEWAFRFTE